MSPRQRNRRRIHHRSRVVCRAARRRLGLPYSWDSEAHLQRFWREANSIIADATLPEPTTNLGRKVKAALLELE